MNPVLQLLAGVTGVVFPFAGSTAPDGWLMCDGSAVSRTTYSKLFAVIGTAYGAGDGANTFNLPDLRGRVAAGKDDMGGAAASRLTSAGSGVNGVVLGAVGGSQSHVLDSTQIPSHTHTGTTGNESATHSHSGTTGSENASHTHGLNQVWDVVSGTSSMTGSGSSGYGPKQTAAQSTNHQHAFTTGGQSTNHTHSFTTAATGGGSAHNNTQPTIVLNHIIKA